MLKQTCLARCLALLVLFGYFALNGVAHAQAPDPAAAIGPAPLVDPLPERILKSELAVALELFFRAPRTQDGHARGTRLDGIPIALPSSAAHARLQALMGIPGESRLALLDLRGILYLSDPQQRSWQPYLDLREQREDFAADVFPNEAGLLGAAFHPQFLQSGTPGFGKFYLAFSARRTDATVHYLADDAGSHISVLSEWTALDPRAMVFEGTHRDLLRVGQFAQNHNIASLAFNPSAAPGAADFGKLYVSFGDGG
ncbi:MAG: hypothetical protein AAF513_07250, partial [Pseudomonadota bacterium]